LMLGVAVRRNVWFIDRLRVPWKPSPPMNWNPEASRFLSLPLENQDEAIIKCAWQAALFGDGHRSLRALSRGGTP